MRPLLCAALFLLAGCVTPSRAQPHDVASPTTLQERSSSTILAVAKANASFDHVTSIGLLESAGLLPSLSWDASDALHLPRPVATLALEWTCEPSTGTATDGPGFTVSFDVQRPDGSIVQTSGGGSMRNCHEREDQSAHDLGAGQLVRIELGATSPTAALDYSCPIHFAATLVSTDLVPGNYTALGSASS